MEDVSIVEVFLHIDFRKKIKSVVNFLFFIFNILLDLSGIFKEFKIIEGLWPEKYLINLLLF